ncbi:MAG: MFS transporter [Gammaproteobacteria bacterium]|nr:MFS transporter [Gammaproteobacteria bacterium]
MGALAQYLPGKRLNRDGYLLCFSAFFADLGYQGVAALFPLDIVFRLHAPVFAYGIVTAIAFGGGSLLAYIGGLAADRFGRKRIAILGNTFIPLMALSGVVHGLGAASALFILGWWARYFRTPARRALLVNVTQPEERAMAFGFLHALDIGGGMLSALAVLLLLYVGSHIGGIMLLAAIPLVISTGLLFFVRLTELHPAETPRVASGPRDPGGRALLIALLVSATLYGFSFYNLGFPILSATGGHSSRAGYEYGVLAFMIYLGVSAVSGYALGAGPHSAQRSVWLFGYLASALGSGLIGLSELFQLHAAAFYLSVAVLGFGMGGVETFEPTIVSSIVGHTRLARGMGFLTVSRSIGQFVSNLIMGLLFSMSSSLPYFYASASAFLAAIIFGSVASGRAFRPRRL